MKASRLKKGGTIGIISPSHIANMEEYARGVAALEGLGFKVKLGGNICKDTYGYAASAQERAHDLNAFVADDEVQMVLFSGGESAVEVLPLIDYENICRHPKLFSSYSDGTSILNAIHAQTGLVTHYGIGVGEFFYLRHYDYTQFCAHFVEGYEVDHFERDSQWKTICSGTCTGTLIGGYTSLFAMMLANKNFQYDKDKKYLLFLEDHECFSKVAAISTYLAFVEQSGFMQNVQGLIFGHYAINAPEGLLQSLQRFGTRNNIPVIYTDDFGHGKKHGVLPIGVRATLDTDKQRLTFHSI